jgi:SpoIID/LytB domain protein
MPSLRRSPGPLLARTVRSVAATWLVAGLVAGALVGTLNGSGPRAAHAQAPTAPSPTATPTPAPLATASGLRFIVGPAGDVDAASVDAASLDAPALAERRAQLLDGAIGVSGVGGGASTVTGFLDTVELLPRRGGVELVNELGFDDYLYGLAEVPRAWPEAVLEAQVIAARTYAWYVMGRSSYADYDICATTACQVFRGAEVLRATGGERWLAAVDATSGQVLTYDDAPILARYFSTSGGRTYANEAVFPSSGPFPYLVGIDDPYDALSPVHRWEVRFLRSEFNELLSRGETLAAAAPYERIERLGAVDDPRAMIRVTGRDGRRVEVAAIALRDFLSSRAPLVFPDRFPPLRADGERPLPSTIPTTRYGIEVTNFEVVITGLGWGHGVGMGQWGAHARALEGQDAATILAAYYNGLVPTRDARVPERIRAGMGAVSLDDGLSLRVTLPTPTRIVDLSGRELATGLGTWRVARELAADGSATGATLVLTPPPGWGAPLEVSPTRVRALRGAGPDVQPGEPAGFDVRTVVSTPVRLRLVVTDADGASVEERDLGVAERGLQVHGWTAADTDGVPLPAGRYLVTLTGTDVTGATAGTAALVELADVAADRDAASDGSDTSADDEAAAGAMPLEVTSVVVVGGAVVALVVLVTPVVLRSRRRRRT